MTNSIEIKNENLKAEVEYFHVTVTLPIAINGTTLKQHKEKLAEKASAYKLLHSLKLADAYTTQAGADNALIMAIEKAPALAGLIKALPFTLRA